MTKKKSGKSNHQFVSERMVGLVILALVLVIGGYYAFDPVMRWLDKNDAAVEPETTEGPSAMADIKTRLEALENKENLDAADYKGRLEAMEQTLAEISQTPAGEGGPAKPDPRIAALEDEVAKLKADLENKPSGGTAGGPDLTFARAVSGLAPPLYQSLSYEGPLQQVRVLVLEMPPLNQTVLSEPLSILGQYSRTGIPGIAALEQNFDKAALEALKVEGLSEDAGWWERTWARVTNLIVVRRTDGVGGTPLEQVLYEAETHLNEGNLKAAMDLISGLPPREGAAFEPWLEDALKRERALEAYAMLVEFISVTPKGTPGQ